MQGVHEIDSGERIACESSWIEREIGMVMGGFLWVKDGNGTRSGCVAAIPTSSRLFETILILVPFKKLNKAGRGGAGMINSHIRPGPFNFFLNFNFF